MADLGHIDCFGLGELVAAYTSLVKAGGEMRLLRVAPRVKQALDLTRLSTIFELYKDEASVMRSFSAASASSTAAKRTQPGSEVFLG